MKPDAYMRWYWNEFWHAVDGLSPEVIVAYQRCISFYYHQNHARGLPDDALFLRRLCRAINDQEWEVMQSTIFDNDKFFCQDANGLWHQKRAAEEWQKSVEDYNKVVNMAKKRWEGTSPAQRSAAMRRIRRAD